MALSVGHQPVTAEARVQFEFVVVKMTLRLVFL